MYVFNNKSYSSICQLAKDVGIPYTTILHRLDRGCSIEEAVKIGKENHTVIIIEGISYESLRLAAEKFNVNPGTLSSRLNSGWTPEQAVGLHKRPKISFQDRKTNPVVVGNTEYPSVFAAARAHGFKPQLINKRMKKGLTIEQSLEIEPFPDWFVPGKGKFMLLQKQKRREKEVATGLRKCSCCKKEKLLSSFHLSSQKERTNRCKDCVSGAFLRYRYKISESDFWSFCKKQNFKCAICEIKLEIKEGSTWRPKTVAVDHCHITDKVRGILCSNCNTGLGMFKDSQSNLHAAIRYLRESQQSNP